MFSKARINLTAWYLFIIMLISISFSIVIYRVLTNEIERFARSQRFRIERQLGGNQTHAVVPPPPILVDEELVEEVRKRLIIALGSINVIIFLSSGLFGYFLAGRTLRPIQTMVDEQNQFITDASHELRTPLTALKSAIEVNLRDKNLTLSHTKKLLTENIKEVNKLQSLSDKLLQLSQYQKPREKVSYDKVRFYDVIQKAIRNVEPIIRRKHMIINNKVEKTIVEGNLYQLIDLFVILLDNAVKYSPNRKTVTIRSQKIDGSLSVSVLDQGIGIEQKDIPHIFDRFYRADSARSKSHVDGYGLGLSIAKKIVDRYRGSIEVQSLPGKGSTFFVRLPLKQT